jgi:hypothetical protein
MSFPEIASLVLFAVVFLQLWAIRWLIRTSMETMRSCSETTDMAMKLARRVLDQYTDIPDRMTEQELMDALEAGGLIPPAERVTPSPSASDQPFTK